MRHKLIYEPVVVPGHHGGAVRQRRPGDRPMGFHRIARSARLRRPLALASLITLLVLGVAVGPTAAAVVAPLAATSGALNVSQLASDVLPALASSTALGAVKSTQAVQVGITLANPNAAAQNAAYDAIYNPRSPDYHHFLTSAQVAAAFGAPAASFDALKSWATRDGLAATFAPNTDEYLLLSGTAAQAERTFSVKMEEYRQAGRTFYANTAGPVVPAGLGIAGVIGLNNLLQSHTDQTTCEENECVGLTTPQDLWSIYDQPKNISNPNADFGQGQSMAILGEGAVSGVISDLRAFEAEHQLPQIKMKIDSVGDDFQDTSGSGEWDIDTQASTGMAPKAQSETLYFAKDLTDPSVLADISAWGSDPNGPYQANASFGECEEDPTSPVTGGGVSTPEGGAAGTAGVAFTQESENALEQATLQGKTLFSSTGDTGSSCPVVAAAVIGAGNGVANQGFPETNYPASSPYVVAVGGTVLYGTESTATAPASNAKRATETAWTFTGGGNTFYIPEPSYQDGITQLDDQDCLSQPDGTPYSTPTPCRGIPDVAAQSGDVVSNGYGVTMGGQNDQAGAGTSLSSPLWMGMWTRVQAAAEPSPSKTYTLGFADPVLYKIGLNATKDARDFFDIGSGPPASPVTANGYYTSLPRTPTVDPSGWDYVSGLGSPNVIPLAKDATGRTSLTPVRNLAQPQPKDCGQPGLLPCNGGSGGDCTVTSGLWQNPPHTATDTLGNSDPQLSLVEGAMSVTQEGSSLRVLLTNTDLTETVPAGAEADEWYGVWSYGGTEWFGNAELTAVPGATPTFHDGTVTKTGNTSSYNPSSNTDDTGHLTLGNDGVVEIDVPMANVGSPTTGAVLTDPAGETDIEVGAPGAGGLLEKVDSGGPTCNYTVGGGPTNP